MVRLILMYHVDFIAFTGKPEKTRNDTLAKKKLMDPPMPTLFKQGGLLLGKRARSPILQGDLYFLEFYQATIILFEKEGNKQLLP